MTNNETRSSAGRRLGVDQRRGVDSRLTLRTLSVVDRAASGGQMKTKQTRSAILNVRLRPALKAEIERWAARDQRTLSNWVELLLEQTAKERRSAAAEWLNRSTS
jgi:hypothetical protein